MQLKNLILGTAQLGLSYGIANRNGKPDQQMADTIIHTAWNHGITVFDTAQGYGNSEQVLGQALLDCRASEQAQVITKLSPLLPTSSAEIETSLKSSRQNLHVSRFFCVMLHREENLPLLDDYVGDTLSEQRQLNFLEHIGISVYSPEKALEALHHPLVDVVQIPGSLFDRRFDDAGVFALAHEKGKSLHVRSVLLQGVLLISPRQLPPCLQELESALTAFQQLCATERMNPVHAALLWMHQKYPDTSLLFGAETAQQVRENLDRSVWQKGLSRIFFEQLDGIIPPQKQKLLNPVFWKR